ncbi:MAG: hypothetical protein HOQ17_01450 [Gemmatimonadaceae bacterium]|nr:hypothetical protein [Gemmatimonadaceae bacterium]NUP55124.1 hypothetical protein [Gemmatimonadaceae bacterium]NUP71022.1 hypothetical protein [Gemmatimonadaceae bacterium]NUR34961.1 hypothetical protein [Gemmatimonadaceae bacterium]NUS31695.1 hypothetical protein [Gemmatimonadaceae bacterium]
MPPAPARFRKAYVNQDHPVVLLRFEDGHEIRVPRGKVKTFDAYAGEIIKIVAVYDPTSTERDLLETVRADELPDAEPHEVR